MQLLARLRLNCAPWPATWATSSRAAASLSGSHGHRPLRFCDHGRSALSRDATLRASWAYPELSAAVSIVDFANLRQRWPPASLTHPWRDYGRNPAAPCWASPGHGALGWAAPALGRLGDGHLVVPARRHGRRAGLRHPHLVPPSRTCASRRDRCSARSSPDAPAAPP